MSGRGLASLIKDAHRPTLASWQENEQNWFATVDFVNLTRSGEHSPPGLFAPRNIRPLDHSPPGPYAPRNIRTHERVAQLLTFVTTVTSADRAFS